MLVTAELPTTTALLELTVEKVTKRHGIAQIAGVVREDALIATLSLPV